MTRTPFAIHTTSTMAALVGAVLSPIPLVDELLLCPMYGMLTWRIGRAHGLGVFRIPWRPITSTAFSGLFARAAINLTVGFIPGVAAVANGASAFALTEFLGRYVDAACASPSEAKAMGVREILSRLRPRRSAGDAGDGIGHGAAGHVAG